MRLVNLIGDSLCNEFASKGIASGVPETDNLLQNDTKRLSQLSFSEVIDAADRAP
jgi:hypothetical protein